MSSQMNTSTKVAELFKLSGQALTSLGELTLQLHPPSDSSSITSCKWTDVEIDQLLNAVKTFSTELNTISTTIKLRTIAQIKSQMRRKAFEEANLTPPPVSQMSGAGTRQTVAMTTTPLAINQSNVQASSGHETNEMTLSALNSPDSTDTDPDLDDLNNSDPSTSSTHPQQSPSAKKPRLETSPAVSEAEQDSESAVDFE